MTYVAHAQIPCSIEISELALRVRACFPRPENNDYINDLLKKKEPRSVKESISALLLLARLLDKSEIKSDDIVLRREQSGKPYFQEADIYFSLTHSKGYVAAVLSDSCRVGLDLEASEITAEKAAKLAERYFTDDELEGSRRSVEAFKRLWTKKESYSKMRGITLAEYIKSSKIGNTELEQNKNEPFYLYLESHSHPLTVCLERVDEQICFFEADL